MVYILFGTKRTGKKELLGVYSTREIADKASNDPIWQAIYPSFCIGEFEVDKWK